MKYKLFYHVKETDKEVYASGGSGLTDDDSEAAFFPNVDAAQEIADTLSKTHSRIFHALPVFYRIENIVLQLKDFH